MALWNCGPKHLNGISCLTSSRDDGGAGSSFRLGGGIGCLDRRSKQVLRIAAAKFYHRIGFGAYYSYCAKAVLP
jgi:hypothetical protein